MNFISNTHTHTHIKQILCFFHAQRRSNIFRLTKKTEFIDDE